jgi:homopolymeric O-antigen transport system permease protein
MSFKYMREMAGASADITKNLYVYRHILSHMVIRDIRGRFAGSVGGFLWNFVHPILMLLVYLFVFVFIFKLRVGSGAGTSVIYLMAGLFPWMIIAEGLMRGTASMMENANIIQKTSFPTEILVAKSIFAPLLSYGVAIVLLALYKILFTGSFSIIFFLPLMIIIQILLTLGVTLLTASVAVFLRDTVQFVQVAVNFWIYLTPILYPVVMLPAWTKKIMYFNPLYPLVDIYQSLFVTGGIARFDMFFFALAWSLVFFVLGAFVFTKLKFEFADWL